MEIPYGLTLSYVDDFGLTFSSSSYHHNVQILQGQYAILKARGSRLGVGFSVPKTELIHLCPSQDRDPPSTAPIYHNESVFRPKGELRWLGLWFTPSLATIPRVRYGGTGPQKTRAPGPFPALPRSTAWGGVSFSAFPAPVHAQAPAPPIPRIGPL